MNLWLSLLQAELVKQNKKQLKQEYKNRPPTIGVFQIRNTLSDKIFLASGKDLPGIINRHRFQLQNGIHPNSFLQEDWEQFGADKFAFEILEELEPPEAQLNVRKELEFMEDMWLARLRPFGERGYNQPKLSTAEKLRRIASKRLDKSGWILAAVENCAECHQLHGPKR